ncbi:MAG TPA: ROK family protein [Candidatus Limnocylindrales bacterium]|nr:ROK family protein [Candidatus Limnocylindrales bacterium]
MPTSRSPRSKTKAQPTSTPDAATSDGATPSTPDAGTRPATPSRRRRSPARGTRVATPVAPEASDAAAGNGPDGTGATPEPAAPADPPTPAVVEHTGAVKPWRDEAPDPKKTEKIAQQAKQLAKKKLDDDQDKAAAEAPREVVDAAGLRVAIGVDVGGSGIKAAAVNLDTGELLSPRHRVPTPQPSAPAAVIASIARLVKKIQTEVVIDPSVPAGVGFPAVVIDGITKSAANVDPGWVDFDADTALERVLRRPVHLVNDADAAGVAEMRFGAGVGERGTVFLITLGTGTGSALFYDGQLVPNLELGHMEIRGRDAERRSAAAARLRRGISWKAWAMDLDEHLLAIEKLFSPKMFIIGGGVSKRSERFIPRLTVRAAVVPAKLLNDAGIVGAAMAAAETESRRAR